MRIWSKLLIAAPIAAGLLAAPAAHADWHHGDWHWHHGGAGTGIGTITTTVARPQPLCWVSAPRRSSVA